MSQFKQIIVQNFDKGAEHYDRYADIQKQIAIELCNRVEGNPKTILEIGCGTGFLTETLIEKFPNAQITATDISPKMILKCQKKFEVSKNLQFEVMDGERVHIDEKFDLIISSMTFQWFESLLESIEGLKNNLTLNGEIYFALPSAKSFPEWRDVLMQNNLNSGLLEVPVNTGVFETQTYKKQYDSAVDFMNKIKKIGAHYSGQNYQSLSAAELRLACRKLDEGDKVMSWIIDYCRVGR